MILRSEIGTILKISETKAAVPELSDKFYKYSGALLQSQWGQVIANWNENEIEIYFVWLYEKFTLLNEIFDEMQTT